MEHYDWLQWKDNPRANLGLYGERRTWPGKYTYPSVDDYSFYLSLHAMFCVAGELLQNRRVVVDEWRYNLWEYWLSNHVLTRKDGTWLADRRDGIPVDCRPVQNQKYDPEWRWAVDVTSFDRALWARSENLPEIVVRGSWQVTEGYGGHENINISSALVSPQTSLALLRALQTTESQEFLYPLCPRRTRNASR